MGKNEYINHLQSRRKTSILEAREALRISDYKSLGTLLDDIHSLNLQIKDLQAKEH